MRPLSGALAIRTRRGRRTASTAPASTRSATPLNTRRQHVGRSKPAATRRGRRWSVSSPTAVEGPQECSRPHRKGIPVETGGPAGADVFGQFDDAMVFPAVDNAMDRAAAPSHDTEHRTSYAQARHHHHAAAACDDPPGARQSIATTDRPPAVLWWRPQREPAPRPAGLRHGAASATLTDALHGTRQILGSAARQTSPVLPE
jgi:hypothetical protein